MTGAGDPADRVFAALADPTRRSLLRTIADDGPLTATVLASGREISRQAVSKHLSVLDDAGLVVAERRGREVRYRADPAPLRSASDWIDDTGSAWDRRLARLARVLDDAGPDNRAPRD